MPSLVDSSIFMQAILCPPSLKKNPIKSTKRYNQLHFLMMCHHQFIRKAFGGFHNEGVKRK